MQDEWKDIDNVFADKLKNLEIEPPSEVWDRVANSLDEKKSRRPIAFWLRLSVAASLLALVGMCWFFASQKQSGKVVPETELQLSENNHTATVAPTIENPSSAKEKKPLFVETKKISPEKTIVENKPEKVKITEREKEQPIVFAAIVPLRSHFAGLLKNQEPTSVLEKKELTDGRLSETDRAIIETNLKLLANADTRKKVDKWSVGANISPAYYSNWSDLTTSDADYVADASSTSSSSTSITSEYNTSVIGGLTVKFQANNRISFETGLNYNTMQQSGSDIVISYAGHNWLTSSSDYAYNNDASDLYTSSSGSSGTLTLSTNMGEVSIEIPEGMTVVSTSSLSTTSSEQTTQSYQYAQHTNYIEVPFLMHYCLFDHRWVGIDFIGGISPNFLVKNKASLVNGSEIIATGYVEGLRQVTLGSNLGMELNCDITKKLVLSLEPMLKLQVTSLSSDADYNIKPYTVGLFTGVSYRF